MGAESKIEWTDATWNPVRGCSRISEGCRNCYAERQAARFSDEGIEVGDAPPRMVRAQPFAGFARRVNGEARWTGRVELIEEKLAEPLRWRKPRRIFVNSMSDLFHEALPDEAIDRVFAVMALAPQHTFQVLTKRPERMRVWVAEHNAALCLRAADEGRTTPLRGPEPLLSRWSRERINENGARVDLGLPDGLPPWPLPNVWLGVSVEDQASADVRIPELLATPAAVRFVSYEPALGPVDFRNCISGACVEGCGEPVWRRNGYETCGCTESPEPIDHSSGFANDLDWIIVGGESGPGARPCDVAWIRSVVDQCRGGGTAVFVKQLGAEIAIPNDSLDQWSFDGDGLIFTEPSGRSFQGESMYVRTLNRKGGDPSEWPADLRVREFPEAVRA